MEEKLYKKKGDARIYRERRIKYYRAKLASDKLDLSTIIEISPIPLPSMNQTQNIVGNRNSEITQPPMKITKKTQKGMMYICIPIS